MEATLEKFLQDVRAEAKKMAQIEQRIWYRGLSSRISRACSRSSTRAGIFNKSSSAIRSSPLQPCAARIIERQIHRPRNLTKSQKPNSRFRRAGLQDSTVPEGVKTGLTFMATASERDKKEE